MRRRLDSLLRIPPLTLLAWLVGLFPLWWLLGIDQIVWVPGLALCAACVVAQRESKLRWDALLKLWLLYLAVQLASAAFIVEPERYITFVRNLSTGVSAALLVFIFTNIQVQSSAVRRVLVALLFALAIGAALCIAIELAGLPYQALTWPENQRLPYTGRLFDTALGRLLPKWIRETSYGSLVAGHGLAEVSFFAGITFARIKSFFMFSTLYSAALAVAIPIAFAFWAGAQKYIKFALLAIYATLFVNFALTTARISFVGFAAGGIVCLLFNVRLPHVSRRVLLWGALALLMACASLLALAPKQLQTQLQGFLVLRGPGSLNNRTAIYLATFAGVAERPLLGWGTERDVYNLPFPAGSHSGYFGALYQHGIPGLALFIMICWTLWRRLAHAKPRGDPFLVALAALSLWSLVAFLVNSLTDNFELDASTFMIAWLIFCLGLATHEALSRNVFVPVYLRGHIPNGRSRR